MSFRAKKRIKVEFVVPDCVAIWLSDLKEFLCEHTNKVVVEYLVESCYLSEVSSESSEKFELTCLGLVVKLFY